MVNKLIELHHITAISGGAQRDYDFYTKTLGLRMVKRTVNINDTELTTFTLEMK